jgi:putative ABC transport system substrate-binding protein
MRRRAFLVVLGGAAVAWPLAARAQQKAMPVIGVLNSAKATPDSSVVLDKFREGLAEAGYYEGRNLAIEYRWAEGQYDQLPALAAELVRRRVDLIVATGGTVSGRAAKSATNTIPIVVLSGADPVAAGFANTLNRPGGNITGVAQLVVEAEAKRLQLLHELVPSANTIAYLENPTLTNVQRQTQEVEIAAPGLGLRIVVIRASREADFATAFTDLAQQQIGALLVGADPFFFMERNQLVAMAERHAVPAMYFFREFVTAGGLISYGTNLTEGYRQIGVYAGKILKGANPADMPIAQQSEKIELVINLKTAKTLGLTVPQSLLARAEEVIE